jgi:hypothetical protein
LFLPVDVHHRRAAVFRDELSGLPYAEVQDGTPAVCIDKLADASRQMYPRQVILSIFSDDDEPKMVVFMAQSWDEFGSNRRPMHQISSMRIPRDCSRSPNPSTQASRSLQLNAAAPNKKSCALAQPFAVSEI